MGFCENCGSRLNIGSELYTLVCPKCGNKKTINKIENIYLRQSEQKLKKGIVIVSNKENSLFTMHTVRTECPKCGYYRAYCMTTEVGKEDSLIEVQIFKCAKCSHTWRER